MRVIFLSVILFSSLASRSQSYELPLASNFIGWDSHFTMESVTVEPTRIVFHTQYHNKFQSRQLNIPQELVLYIPDIYRSIPLASGSGSYLVKMGKRYSVDLVFTLDWNEITRYSDNALFVMDVLKMRITTNKDFTDPQPAYNSSDWRFDFRLPLSIEQQLTLGCASYLSNFTVKSEFETTSAYNARLSPDSVKGKLLDEMEELLDIVTIPSISKLGKIEPQLSYNADAEMFTLNYNTALTKPVQIKVPLARAKAFKEGATSGNYRFSVGNLGLNKDGTYFIGVVKVYDSGKKAWENFDNISPQPQPEGLQWLADRVLAELTKKHPSGKLLKA